MCFYYFIWLLFQHPRCLHATRITANFSGVHNVSTSFSWLTDYWLTFNEQPFIYIQDENRLSNTYNPDRKERNMGQTVATAFDYPWRIMEIWVGTKKLVFINSYNAPTRFRNLQKRSLMCREDDTLQIRHPLWSSSRLSAL